MLQELDPNEPKDFDFIIGDWQVKHRRLKDILNGSDEWIEFEGKSSTVKTLGGLGNVEDNLLHMPSESIRAKAIRSYNGKSKEWSIWWLDGRNPMTMDTPVVGRFVDGIGHFFADETYNGLAVKVRFIWDSTTPEKPTWQQAFSKDNGETWEVNWQMEFSRVE
ncbi:MULTISPECIES: DUF1579 domain-containing protein [Pseudoalteromonas]|uniref:DUF1579 domain-containing protein n=1 Tax=Pseudoalteromonas obscura TaxID=3048491 RepID=A0ABT7EKQ7_9GAMM|nr:MULTISPECIES: DUF1579 domain-containing protein [Pseudoalteromonas]MBQ4837167.1 DUF1579 domain-containing protein [Pseudoalteromonas luteoviolacea]MDK2595607.1 DUF1579 domain-containing protein [Pseudoalteromonas sp. P94(2023)]